MNITTRKRSSSGSKRPKDKVVLIYELNIFKLNAEAPDYQELFTLQPNSEALESEISKLTNDQLIAIKGNLITFLIRAIETLNISSGESSLNFKQCI